MQTLPQAFAALADYRQWVIWKVGPTKADGKQDKFVLHPQTLKVYDAHNPDVWTDPYTAMGLAAATGLNVGFVFTHNDPFFFIDIDRCLEGNAWNATALELCQKFQGCAVEVSQSGTGLHIFGKYTGAEPIHGCKNKRIGVEYYTSGRFAAMTGNGAMGDSGMVADTQLQALTAQYFQSTAPAGSSEWTSEPDAEWSGPEDDAQLIQAMLNARGSAAVAFGERASIRDLWEANEDVLSAIYPDNYGKGRPFDNSDADAALAAHLAFWTGKNCERMDRLFRQSALIRDKWLDREDYRYRTLTRAVSGCRNVYKQRVADLPQQQTAAPQGVIQQGEIRNGSTMLTPYDQLELFKGCVYVRADHKVFTPNGAMLKPDQFNVMYGGYVFVLGADNGKVSTSAWETFTQSQAVRFPKVDATIFRPEQPSGVIIIEESRTLVNVYVPIETPSEPGDVSPFLGLLDKLFPNGNDKQIILNYMAALVQSPGVKFTWAPLIQGVEGGGKGFIVSCLERAIGFRYTHKPAARDIDNTFNAWLNHKLFIAIEEVYVKGDQDKLDALKEMITGERVSMTPKGVDSDMRDNRANFMLNMNPRKGYRLTRNDRRICYFSTPQQHKDDLRRDGMDGAYFPNLWKWAKAGGFAHVNHYLHEFVIDGALNPAGDCQTAPATSSTEAAILGSMGGVEQEILEAVEEERSGFAGGWISSVALNKLLESRRADRAIPHNERREVLAELGYVWHPALRKGRLNQASPIDGGAKPKIYIRMGHIHANLTTPAEVFKQYLEAQGYILPGGVDTGVNKV